MKNKVYLFDFDGTLVDSMPAYVGVMTRILDENNISYDESIIKIITPLGFEGTAAYFQEIGIKKTREELGAQMKKYAYDEYAYNIPAKKNVVEVLGELKKRGASLNVLTASPHSVLDVCLKRLGIFELFTGVWSCEDFDTTPSIFRTLIIDGKEIYLKSNVNTCVLIGYNLAENTVILADPSGVVFGLDMDLFEKRFSQVGSYAVIIK